MIVQDYLSISLVDGFRNLMNILAPDYKVPSRNTIRSRICRIYEEQKIKLLSELSSVSSVSLTTDTWTSTATVSYITVTEHHISDDWEIKSNVLCTREMPERHTGENIASKLRSVVSEFDLDDKVEMCVHDTKNVMPEIWNPQVKNV